MSVNNFKLLLLLIGSFGSICASNPLNSDSLAALGGGQKTNAYRAPTARSGRSSAFGSVLEYGKVLEAYSDARNKVFPDRANILKNVEGKFCIVWDWLEDLVSLRGSTRSLDALVDSGMFSLYGAQNAKDLDFMVIRSINLLVLLLRPEFANGSELSTWQKKFVEVAGSQEIAYNFFEVVQSNPAQALTSEPAKVLQELFFGVDGKFEGLVSRYDKIRRDDAIRDNTFELFESLLAETVSARSIQLLKAEAAEKDKQIAAAEQAAAEKDKQIAAAKAESDAKIAALQKSLEDAAEVAKEESDAKNAARDEKQQALADQMKALETVMNQQALQNQQAENKKLQAAQAENARLQAALKVAQEKKGPGCVIQ